MLSGLEHHLLQPVHMSGRRCIGQVSGIFKDESIKHGLKYTNVSLDHSILSVCLSSTHSYLDVILGAILNERISLEATFRVDMPS